MLSQKFFYGRRLVAISVYEDRPAMAPENGLIAFFTCRLGLIVVVVDRSDENGFAAECTR